MIALISSKYKLKTFHYHSKRKNPPKIRKMMRTRQTYQEKDHLINRTQIKINEKFVERRAKGSQRAPNHTLNFKLNN